jgi:hypothetical protein
LGTGANATRREFKAVVSPFVAFSIAACAYVSSKLRRMYFISRDEVFFDEFRGF